MSSYRHNAHGVVITLPDDHAVELGSEWAKVGDPAEKPAARSRKKSADDE